MIEPAIRTLLAAVTGTGLNGRLFPQVIPEGVELPAAAYWRADTGRGYANDGPDGLAAGRFMVAIYAPTAAATRTAAEAIVAALSGYAGEVKDAEDVSLGFIAALFIENESDDYDDRAATFSSLIQMTVNYRE